MTVNVRLWFFALKYVDCCEDEKKSISIEWALSQWKRWNRENRKICQHLSLCSPRSIIRYFFFSPSEFSADFLSKRMLLTHRLWVYKVCVCVCDFVYNCTCTSIYHPYLQSNSDASNFVGLIFGIAFDQCARLSVALIENTPSCLDMCVNSISNIVKCTIVTQRALHSWDTPKNSIYNKWVCWCRSVKGQRNVTTKGKRRKQRKNQEKKVFKLEQKLWPGKVPKTNQRYTKKT